jgi:hypothetical protein
MRLKGLHGKQPPIVNRRSASAHTQRIGLHLFVRRDKGNGRSFIVGLARARTCTCTCACTSHESCTSRHPIDCCSHSVMHQITTLCERPRTQRCARVLLFLPRLHPVCSLSVCLCLSLWHIFISYHAPRRSTRPPTTDPFIDMGTLDEWVEGMALARHVSAKSVTRCTVAKNSSLSWYD